MEIIEQKELTTEQKQQIHEIWNTVYSAKIAHKSIEEFEKYLTTVSPQKHIVAIEDNKVMGWYFQFVREGEVWFAILLHPNAQGKGLGRTILSQAKADATELNGWVIDKSNEPKLDGSIYQSPLAFYTKNGFTVLNDVRLEVDVISAVKIKWSRD